MTQCLTDRINEAFKVDKPPALNWLDWLIANGLDQLPTPGAGATYERWQALSAVAQFDLSLAKHFEGHTDALAIIQEIGNLDELNKTGAWCVWASESPGGHTTLERKQNGQHCIAGVKLWCSGALTANHALLTAWPANATLPQLVAVNLDQPGISVNADQWKAVGMANSLSVKVSFDNVSCLLVGQPGAYLNRPGFWQGGAGVAACWLGGAIGIANTLQQSLQSLDKQHAPHHASTFKFAALGKAYLSIAQTTAVLRSAAQWIDAHPGADASRVALLARLSAEQCAKVVIHEVGQAMGASPFCLDEKFARATADLPVFIRQSHAEKDFAALGERAVDVMVHLWAT